MLVLFSYTLHPTNQDDLDLGCPHDLPGVFTQAKYLGVSINSLEMRDSNSNGVIF